MAKPKKPAATASLKPRPVSGDAAAKIRGGEGGTTVTLKKLPGKKTPPTLTLK